MEKTITKHKWFWAWQDDREEAWLTRMAREGCRLKSINPFGFYTFEAGARQDVVYRLDFQNQNRKQDKLDYLQLFADAGWEHVGTMGGWQYFRKAVAAGEEPELYSDVESKIQKYRRLSAVFVIFLPIMVLLNHRLSQTTTRSEWYAILLFLSLILLITYIFCMIQFLRRINQLKKSRGIRS